MRKHLGYGGGGGGGGAGSEGQKIMSAGLPFPTFSEKGRRVQLFVVCALIRTHTLCIAILESCPDS